MPPPSAPKNLKDRHIRTRVYTLRSCSASSGKGAIMGNRVLSKWQVSLVRQRTERRLKKTNMAFVGSLTMATLPPTNMEVRKAPFQESKVRLSLGVCALFHVRWGIATTYLTHRIHGPLTSACAPGLQGDAMRASRRKLKVSEIPKAGVESGKMEKTYCGWTKSISHHLRNHG